MVSKAVARDLWLVSRTHVENHLNGYYQQQVTNHPLCTTIHETAIADHRSMATDLCFFEPRTTNHELLLLLSLISFTSLIRHVHAFQHVISKEVFAIRRNHHDLQLV